jgi:hypothetical protein
MATHMTTPPDVGWIDPRKAASNDDDIRGTNGPTVFTANAGGTTATIVGANAAPGTPSNVIRIGEKVKLKNSSGVLKEETVFTVTAVAVAASTTVTFSPAALVNTASGDTLTLVSTDWYQDNDSLDRRLIALGFSQSYVDRMTQNDKVYQIRLSDDPGSF